MKKFANLLFSPTLSLLLALFGASLLGGCYYPYYYDGTAVQPVSPVATGYYTYYGYSWPGYYYGPSYYQPYYYGGFWRSRPSPYYYYSTSPRRWNDWRQAPGYRPNGSRPQAGWQNRTNNPATSITPQSASPGFRSSSGGGQSHSGGRR